MRAPWRDVIYTNDVSLIATTKQDVFVLLPSSACAVKQPRLCVVVTV